MIFLVKTRIRFHRLSFTFNEAAEHYKQLPLVLLRSDLDGQSSEFSYRTPVMFVRSILRDSLPKQAMTAINCQISKVPVKIPVIFWMLYTRRQRHSSNFRVKPCNTMNRYKYNNNYYCNCNKIAIAVLCTHTHIHTHRENTQIPTEATPTK